MNNIIISSLTLFFVFVTSSRGSSSMVSIKIDLASRKISCLAHKDDSSVKKITSMQLRGPQVDKLIVNVDEDSPVTVNKDTKLFIMETHGKIEKAPWWDSYLDIELSDIPSSHFGYYTCTVYYLNENDVQKHTSTYEQLEIKSEGIKTDLDNVRYTVYTLEKGIKHLTSEVRQLEEASKTQRNRIAELEEKGKVFAFTAYYNIADKFKDDDVLLFRNVRINRGNAYNPTTGVFTAPKKGVYLFTVTITTESSGDGVWVRIYQNEEEVGKLYAKDIKASGDQSSKTLLLQLSPGDQVKTKVKGTTNALEDYKVYSVFSGFLAHAD